MFREKERDRKGEEGRRSEGGGENPVDRFAKIFSYAGSVAYEFFCIPLKSSRSNSRATNRTADVGRENRPHLASPISRLGYPGLPFPESPIRREKICVKSEFSSLIFKCLSSTVYVTVAREKIYVCMYEQSSEFVCESSYNLSGFDAV